MRFFRFTQAILFFCLFVTPFANMSAEVSEVEMASSSAVFDGESIRIEVDLQQQLVRVLEKGALIKEMPCSTGKADTPTPAGSFKTYEKIEDCQAEINGTTISYFYMTKFNGGIGLHSKIFGDSPLVEEWDKKFENREPSSGGCVRLLLSDAKWLYETIGVGAKVEVH